jgi:uncharacterized phiE125 gp8 family phage protein
MITPYDIIKTEADVITEPVLLADVKAWSKIETTDEDALLTEMIVTAREDIENEIGVKLVESSVSFRVSHTDQENDYVLPVFPGAFSPSAATNVVINSIVNGEDPVLKVEDTDYYLNGVLTIPATGGYLLTYDVVPVVPRTIKEAIKMLVDYRYKNRGGQDKDLQQGIPDDILRKLSKYKQEWL